MAEVIGKIGRESGGFRVVYDIDSRFGRRELWRAISDRDALAVWLGTFSNDLVAGSHFAVEYLNDSHYDISGTVREIAQLRTLEYDWKFGDYPTTQVRFELENGLVNGTHLRLIVSGLDEDDVVRAASTWHAQLEFVRLFLNQIPVPAYALRFRRDELLAAYEQQVRCLGTAPAASDTTSPSTPARHNPALSVMHSHAYLA